MLELPDRAAEQAHELLAGRTRELAERHRAQPVRLAHVVLELVASAFGLGG